MKAIERLEQLLDEKDGELEELQKKLDDIEDRDKWSWCKHSIIEDEGDGLPVPRLEIRHESLSEDGYLSEWRYSLIYKHFLGHLVCVPLGHTGRQGSSIVIDRNGNLMLPFRDGAHIASDSQTMGIPAVGIAAGKAVSIIKDVDGKTVQRPFP